MYIYPLKLILSLHNYSIPFNLSNPLDMILSSPTDFVPPDMILSSQTDFILSKLFYLLHMVLSSRCDSILSNLLYPPEVILSSPGHSIFKFLSHCLYATFISCYTLLTLASNYPSCICLSSPCHCIF